MTDDIDWSALARYVAGACSDEERRSIEVWMAGDPAHRETVEALEQIWDGAKPAPDHWNVPAAWRELVRKEAASREAPVVRALRTAEPWRHQGDRRWAAAPRWAAAAVVALALGATLWWKAGAASRSTGAAAAAAPMQTIATAAGQRMALRLPDGTRVVLSVASRLRYPSTYGAERREVYLDGEAYFDVIHDVARPFAVHAGNAIAHDLGTRFGVRAYADESRVQVVVAEGKVALQGGEAGRAPAAGVSDGGEASAAGRLLAAGELGRVETDGAVSVRSSVNVDDYLAWTDGRLLFRDARLRDVLPQLGRWYDVEFQLGDSALGDRQLTGAFKDESLPDVLQFLALSLDARYERHGRMVTISPKGRAP